MSSNKYINSLHMDHLQANNNSIGRRMGLTPQAASCQLGCGLRLSYLERVWKLTSKKVDVMWKAECEREYYEKLAKGTGGAVRAGWIPHVVMGNVCEQQLDHKVAGVEHWDILGNEALPGQHAW